MRPIRTQSWCKREAALLAALVLTGMGCAPIDNHGESVSLRRSSQATAALTRFDRQNPACRLWTDWESLCSRTGPNMAPFCKKDPGFRAQPSEPFCVNQRVSLGITFAGQFDTLSQRQSRNRFCERFADREGADSADRSMAMCEEYALRRPFDGVRSEAVSHPLCRKWEAASGGGISAPRRCVSWVDDLPCSSIIGNAYRHPFDGKTVGGAVSSRGNAVWGVACLEKDMK